MSVCSPLLLLSAPSTIPLLSDLADRPRPLADLRGKLGSPPETTIRGHLRPLTAAGLVEKRRHGGFPGSVDYRLTAAGQDLIAVWETLAAWLAAAPGGGAPPGSRAAKGAIKILIESWRTGIVRALAAGPRSLTELAGAAPSLSYPALERRVSAMRRLGFVRALPGSRGKIPLEVGDWLRLAVAPLAAAARWERRWLPDPTPIVARDIETGFLLVLAPLRLPQAGSGACRLAVRIAEGQAGEGEAGVTAEMREGIVASCLPEPGGIPSARVDGSLDAWIATILDRDPRGLELGGETRLAKGLVEEMQQRLRLA